MRDEEAKQETAEARAARKFGGITMHPFTYSAIGQEYAANLAETCSTYEEGSDENIALALLISGLAAIENADDRHALTYFALERLLSKTDRFGQP
ncbi:MAG: hypothetical protein WBP93_05325 [Pyrinomonadaceae bacterium]